MSGGVKSWNWLGRVTELNKPSHEEEEPVVRLFSQTHKMLLAVVNDSWSHLSVSVLIRAATAAILAEAQTRIL